MTRKLTAFLLFWQFLCAAQDPSNNVESEYYNNGSLKTLFIKRGKDTVEIKKFYKSGRIRDSIWMYLSEKDEIPFGTSRSFHENGQLALVTHYVKGNEQYVSYEFSQNGKLKRFEQRPTGLTKLYNRKGVQVVEYDYHKLKDVYIAPRFRNGKHLRNTRFENRIKSNKAMLTGNSVQKEFNAGALITMELVKDTIRRTHCQVEGFSADTVFISDFHYNEDFQRKSKVDILKYDSTFAVPVNQIRKLLYAKNNTKKRVKIAQFCTIAGAELILLPIIPLAVLPFVGVEVLSVFKLYAAFAIPGTGLFFIGKNLFKSAVPRQYDLNKYRIVVKS